MLSDWLTITKDALLGLWDGFINFTPNLIAALVVFLIGWIISVAIGKLITGILRKIKFNRIFEKGGWKGTLEKAEIKVDASDFIGAIFKWVLMIVVLVASVKILGFVQLDVFLTSVLNFLPNVIVAALIFVVAIIIADILEKIIRAAVEGIKVGYGRLVGAIVKWSILIFAILAILVQLGIGKELILTMFTGFVALLAIAGGLAFGLGGKDIATEILRDLRTKLKK